MSNNRYCDVWTHRYRYEARSSFNGRLLTGEIQVGKPYSEFDVKVLLRKMHNDKYIDLIWYQEVEARHVNG